MTNKNSLTREQLKQDAEENKLFLTEAERALWKLLRGNGIGLPMKQQQIIGDFIADFANLHKKMVIEIAGKYHFKGRQPIDDRERTRELNRMGFTVVKITEEELRQDSRKVAYQLKDIVKKMEIYYQKNSTSQPAGHHARSEYRANQAQSVIMPGTEGWDRTAWAVDAACSGNPGPMEYRGVDLQTGNILFHFGPIHGTNNIGEFLAIVHALAMLDKEGIRQKTIYSDSKSAISWVKKKKCKTQMERNETTEHLFRIIMRAEEWLKKHNVTANVEKWNTKEWGEIPADFGNK